MVTPYPFYCNLGQFIRPKPACRIDKKTIDRLVVKHIIMNKYIGIDISKQTFDAYGLNRQGEMITLKPANDPKGFRELLKHFDENQVFVMEATGPYYLKLAMVLHANGRSVSVVNPLVIKRFSQMQLQRAKTDRKDAQTIRQYAILNPVELWHPEPKEILEMQQILTSLELLNKQRTATKNQLGAFTSSGIIDSQVKKTLETIIKVIEEERNRLERRLNEIVEAHYAETKQLLESIPGIGPKASAILIAITANFEKFAHHKQLTAYVGLSPRVYSSGTSVKGRGHICKMGKAQVRKQLYMSSWSAKIYNKACSVMYERLKEKGKPERVIKIAIANKLLKQAYAIATSRNMYNERYGSSSLVA